LFEAGKQRKHDVRYRANAATAVQNPDVSGGAGVS
jgi:hypothetical protein